MSNAKRLLLASVAIAMVSGAQAFAAPPTPRPFVLAQAGNAVPEVVAAAEAKVEAARADLQKAMASGQGVKEARQALRTAQKELKDARLAAGLPPTNQPPAAAGAAPSPGQQQPAAAKAPPQPEQAPAEQARTPPPPDRQPPATTETRRKLPKGLPAEAKAPPQPQQTPAAEAKVPAPATKPPAPQTASEQPPASPPPTTMDNGQPPPKFNPQMLKRPHPRFGEAPKQDQNVQLPKQEAQVPTGAEINAGAGRTIVREDNGQVTVRHDDTERFQRLGGNAQVQRGRDGTTTTTVTRPDGVQVVTIRDRDGTILQRYRKDRNGQIEVLIGQVGPQGNDRRPPPPPKPPAPNATFDFHVQLPPLKLTIPQNQYVVESSGASRQQLAQTFEAPPVERVERPYSLEEIRRSDRIRNKVRRVDFDTVTFEFGSAVLPDDQIPQMEKVGEAMQDVLKRDPGQVFLIEGHTDAVGSDLANLALSDRRAETVAEILTYYFAIPPENLVTQGYGEQYLKIPTEGPERENRRVAFRNITPLMRTGSR